VGSNFLLQPLLVMEQKEPALRGTVDARTDLAPTPAELSLVPGGPFYRTQQAVGLISPLCP
jgi:hypothetical protein